MLCASPSFVVKRSTIVSVRMDAGRVEIGLVDRVTPPTQAAVGVVACDLDPAAGAAGVVDLDQQAIGAVGIGQTQEVVVADRDSATGEVHDRRDQADGAAVDVGVAGFVLRQVALSAAVGIGCGVILPAIVINRQRPRSQSPLEAPRFSVVQPMSVSKLSSMMITIWPTIAL